MAQSEGSVTFELTDSGETRSAYPYAFKLNMTYELTGPACLTPNVRAWRTPAMSTCPSPWAAIRRSTYPAPGGEGEAFDDYELAFTKPWSCVAPKILPTAGCSPTRTAEMGH